MRCPRATLGCRWPDTHADHDEWVRRRWTGTCTCGHPSMEHRGLSPHGCRGCDCPSFYPLEGQEAPTREAVLEASA